MHALAVFQPAYQTRRRKWSKLLFAADSDPLLLLLAVFVVQLAFSAPGAQSQTTDSNLTPSKARKSYRILYLNMQLGMSPWSLRLVAACHDELEAKTGAMVEMVEENFYLPKGTDPKVLEVHLDLLKQKYSGKIDFILVRSYFKGIKKLAGLFPSVGILIPSLDSSLLPAKQEIPPNIYILVAHMSPVKTITAALAMRPGASRVIVVSGLSYAGRFLRGRTMDEMGTRFNGVPVEYWDGFPLQELYGKTRTLDGDQILLYLTMHLDRENITHVSQNVLRNLAAISKAPIFGVASTNIPYGAAGGYLFSAELAGKQGGRMMSRLIKGEKLPQISQVMDYGEYTFDWQQMRRWNISEDLLPAGARLINRPSDFTKRHPWIWPAVIIVAALLVAGLSLLVWYLKQRNRNQAMLLEKEEGLRKAQKAGNVGLWQIDSQQGTIEISEECANIHGIDRLVYDLDEFEKLFPPETIEVARKAIDQAASGNGIIDLELRFIHQVSGEERWVHSYGRVQKDREGKVIGYSGTIQDITERKRAAETLRESEQLFRSAFNNTRLGMALVSPAGKFLSVNDSLSDILGYNPRRDAAKVLPGCNPSR